VQHILWSTYFLQIVRIAHRQKKLCFLHLNKPPVHKAKAAKPKLYQIPVSWASYRLYSPDLVPWDFFLFGCLTQKLLAVEFDRREASLDWIKTGISQDIFRGS
jgi:hypothetical protein